MHNSITFNKFFVYQIVLLSLCFVSCQKDKQIFSDNPNNFSKVFETFWNKMNTNYVYWDIDTTGWDQMYHRYRPFFETLDLDKTSDVMKSVQYFKEMTNGLMDGHFYINFSNPAISSTIIFPSFSRKQRTPDFRPLYYYYNIDKNYLDPNFHFARDINNHHDGKALTILCGTIKYKILYCSISRFSLYKSYSSKSTNDVQATLQYFFDVLTNLPVNIKGLILDVRGNQGGDLSDLNFFVGHFIDSPLHFGYTQSKSNFGRLDFTPWIKAYVNPYKKGKRIEVPIIILADSYTASLAEATLMALKLLPNSLFIGEATWGATGPITEEELYNAGSFIIPNFLSVQTSSCKFKYIDGKIYESIGISPDIYVPFDYNLICQGRDIQLEKAISLFE